MAKALREKLRGAGSYQTQSSVDLGQVIYDNNIFAPLELPYFLNFDVFGTNWENILADWPECVLKFKRGA